MTDGCAICGADWAVDRIPLPRCCWLERQWNAMNAVAKARERSAWNNIGLCFSRQVRAHGAGFPVFVSSIAIDANLFESEASYVAPLWIYDFPSGPRTGFEGSGMVQMRLM